MLAAATIEDSDELRGAHLTSKSVIALFEDFNDFRLGIVSSKKQSTRVLVVCTLARSTDVI
jgi:hypothetical protein